MPPRAKPETQLVPVGKKEVFSKTNPARQHGKRDEQGQRPTTSKALILRNGKYGSQGTGELMHMGKMSGREKLDLLAENLVEQSKKAILSPLRLEKCLKMAESQTDVYLDDIMNLREPDTFLHIIESELKARSDPEKEPRRTPTNIAKLVATRAHNSFMLASAWNIVSEALNGLVIDGLTDNNVKTKLRDDPDMRERYLVLCNVLDVLVKMNQDRFSVLATTAPRYAKYFKSKASESEDPTAPEYVFNYNNLRKTADSFLDSIIVELCFPQGVYPKAILYRILHDAVDESPREARRFPQALWDAVGDLAISVELQELLEAPLFGSGGETWKKQPRQMPEEYESWVDAQLFSEKASNLFATFKDMIFPLERTRNKSVLDRMWKQIDQNYISTCGLDIDSLWHLEDAFDRKPQWTGVALTKLGEDSDDDSFVNSRRAIVKKNNKQSKLLAIGNGGDDESDDSMPGLQSVSNSDNDDGDDDEDSDSDDDLNDDGDSSDSDESGYNSDDEEEIRQQLRAAMDAAHESNWLDADPNLPKELDPFYGQDHKGNPFLKLLGSLRGRMFTASPKLRTATRTEPRASARGAFRATPSGIPKAVPTAKPSKPDSAPPSSPSRTSTSTTTPVTPPPKSQRATVEEVEDEDNIKTPSQKKKKKKSKKKKSASAEPAPASPPSVQYVDPTASHKTSIPLSPPSPSSQPYTASKTSYNASYMSSMASLALKETTTAQSSHSYLQKENLMKSDKKVKSRPDHASLFSNAEEKKGLFSNKFSSASKGEVRAKESEKSNWFSKLGKKTTGLMHQLLRPGDEQKRARAPMKWENFLKLMREMGFEYDPSTAGSSVRFDPPNKNDKPITFHKPHPDPTLQPMMLNEFAKKLKRAYGWNEEDLMKLDGNRF
ncbi:hypothetical protein HYPSUDRAFT_35071 [Hypholoma sublateritium FD-334 SS-4]|uniref:Uncharacterized protein n=1 Tax=Hypholoma sublateritium (strain FD-334 SS-4) TaxID=945553 RepID=A0A0D2PHA1_HYPSF|nr:hypothetical protein HYPSUDRAFT_35071 [Hypholoma sublateritium FD-334 SS-4]